MLEPKVQSQSGEGKQEPKRCQGGGSSRNARAMGGRDGECELQGYCAIITVRHDYTVSSLRTIQL